MRAFGFFVTWSMLALLSAVWSKGLALFFTSDVSTYFRLGMDWTFGLTGICILVGWLVWFAGIFVAIHHEEFLSRKIPIFILVTFAIFLFSAAWGFTLNILLNLPQAMHHSDVVAVTIAVLSLCGIALFIAWITWFVYMFRFIGCFKEIY